MLNVQNVFRDVASSASEQALSNAISKCERANIAFKPLVRTGQVAKTIADVAREEHAGQIVMGTRGLGGGRCSWGISVLFFRYGRYDGAIGGKKLLHLAQDAAAYIVLLKA